MVEYEFELKSDEKFDEDTFIEIAESTDDGKDDSVYASIGFNMHRDDEGHILIEGTFPDPFTEIEEQLFNEYDIVRVLAELRTDYEANFSGQFVIKIGEKSTIFDENGKEKK